VNETMYLLDNHVLGPLGPKRRASAFFRENCRIPKEVAYEARFFTYDDSLKPITVAMTPNILHWLVEVMKTVPAAPSKLIDLHANKGTADPVLVAMALAFNNPTVPSLFPDTWVIVTKDQAVILKATEMGIGTETPERLHEIMDAAHP